MKIKMDELLLIAGTGRNSGKTTMACTVIRNISQHQPVLGLKITPHFHENILSGNLLVNRPNLVILEEPSTVTGTYSSRLLQEGGTMVLSVMARDEQLAEAMTMIKGLNPERLPVVCESGGAIHCTEPGLFLLMNRREQMNDKPEIAGWAAKADLLVSLDGDQPHFQTETITFNFNKWQITPKY